MMQCVSRYQLRYLTTRHFTMYVRQHNTSSLYSNIFNVNINAVDIRILLKTSVSKYTSIYYIIALQQHTWQVLTTGLLMNHYCCPLPILTSKLPSMGDIFRSGCALDAARSDKMGMCYHSLSQNSKNAAMWLASSLTEPPADRCGLSFSPLTMLGAHTMQFNKSV